ncbi:MAG: hydrolase [Pirellulaceae bacterium]|nr:hydrolase [Pirellulaceae bacterium]
MERRLVPRSAELMSQQDTVLLVIDIQEKLIGKIENAKRLVWNVRRLLDGAGELGLKILATEQYPKGLGPMLSELAEGIPQIPSKMMFSCRGCPETIEQIAGCGAHKVLLCGIETHVCVQQTAFDLMASGYRVYLAADAVGSRFRMDHELALQRMESSGVTVTTTEAALFEWCEVAGTPEFKRISRIVREPSPTSFADD